MVILRVVPVMLLGARSFWFDIGRFPLMYVKYESTDASV
jgi:hypothetical protein